MMVGDRPFTKNYFIGQFISVNGRVIRKVSCQGLAQFIDAGDQAVGYPALFQMVFQVCRCCFPEYRASRKHIDLLVAHDGELMIIQGHINKYSVTTLCGGHTQLHEYLTRPVHGIDIVAPGFQKNPELAGSARFGRADGGDNTFLVIFVEQDLFWK